MRTLRHYPPHDTIVPSPHSVCVSFPTMADVLAYEEKEPAALERVGSAYPRFREHRFICRLADTVAGEHGLAGRTLSLLPSAVLAREMIAFIGAGAQAIETAEGLFGVHVSTKDTDALQAARSFLQHTGALITSRQAEDILFSRERLQERFAEATFEGSGGAATATVKAALSPLFGNAAPADLFLCNCGMGAFHAGYRALRDAQATRGKTLWVQLGWLYTDTISILQKWAPQGCAPLCWLDVLDLDGLEAAIAASGQKLAGIVTEVPTNPLLQSADVTRLRRLCDAHEAALVLDPTVASPYNIDVSAEADLLVNSLTKYAASEGDLMIGALALNPRSPFHGILRERLPALVEPPYGRDLRRLAMEIARYSEVTARFNANTEALSAMLEKHPAVARVYHAKSAPVRANFEAKATATAGLGCLFTFTLQKERALPAFYDNLRAAKSPSFGITTTLVCPFMYLAHYDLVKTAQGRARLREAGLEPDLVRVSCGTEPTDELLAAFAEALDPLA